VDQALISLVDKEVMRKKLNAVFEIIRAYNKTNAAVKLAAANSKADEVAREALASGKQVIIAAIDFSADGKVAKKIFERLKALHPHASFFIASADEEADRYALILYWGAAD
jgi:peptidoglycan/xylan/chitin deacetylase (PgdA/CDA1 family)